MHLYNFTIFFLLYLLYFFFFPLTHECFATLLAAFFFFLTIDCFYFAPLQKSTFTHLLLLLALLLVTGICQSKYLERDYRDLLYVNS